VSETLPGRRALVTGASRGIGRALALELAARGVEVWASARGADDLEKLETEARGLDGRLICAPVDLESDESIGALVASVLGAGPELDLLVHSAGVLSMGAVADAPVAELDRLYRINVRAVYLLTQGLLDAVAKGAGRSSFSTRARAFGRPPRSAPTGRPNMHSGGSRTR
jgi:NAD(P)-dependent dehydrogenase (short-subunit alcohol dehydrogenase family)